MLNLRQRLRKLERSPMFKEPTDRLDPVIGLALQQMSNEHFGVLADVVRDQHAGLYGPLSQPESVAVDAYEAALANVKGSSTV
jgi:hypothetical protein